MSEASLNVGRVIKNLSRFSHVYSFFVQSKFPLEKIECLKFGQIFQLCLAVPGSGFVRSRYSTFSRSAFKLLRSLFSTAETEPQAPLSRVNISSCLEGNMPKGACALF